jgi:catechol 2,3-dioxygenase-like lactoylglutathione lyase family enzyme
MAATDLLTHLRHVDLAVPDFGRERDFMINYWGLVPTTDDTGISFLAAQGSPEQYVVRLRKADEKRLDLIAFGTSSQTHVDTLAERLLAGGSTLITRPDALTTPGGGYGFRFFDIDGRTIEVSYGTATRRHRKIEERESIPVRLSHVVLNSADPDRTRDWYVQNLAFTLSDTLASPHFGSAMHFMRINPQHHSIAISKAPHTSMHHLAFEMRGIDEYMRGTGRLIQAGVTKLWGPGRHPVGDNTFSYFLDPHGNIMEYTTAMEELDEDTWHPSVHPIGPGATLDDWGTANPMDEFVREEMNNDRDKGVFIAPPV